MWTANVNDIINILLEKYISSLKETEIPTILTRPPPSKEALKSYLATHLSLSTKFKRKCVKFFLQKLDEATRQKILTKKDVFEILHFRKVDHRILDTTIMNIAVLNHDKESATEILAMEKEVHNHIKSSLLQCARSNLENLDLKQWTLRQINEEVDKDCLGKIGINKTLQMWISIVFGTVLLSMLPYAMDQERQILKKNQFILK